MLWKQADQGEEGQVAMLHWKVKLSFSEKHNKNLKGNIGQDIWENNIRLNHRASRRLTEATGWTQRDVWLVLSGWVGAGVRREVAVEGRNTEARQELGGGCSGRRDPLGMLVCYFLWNGELLKGSGQRVTWTHFSDKHSSWCVKNRP